MTDQEQQRANHLALVAAPIYAAFRASDDWDHHDDNELRRLALNEAEALQRAAEERVAKP